MVPGNLQRLDLSHNHNQTCLYKMEKIMLLEAPKYQKYIIRNIKNLHQLVVEDQMITLALENQILGDNIQPTKQ